MRWLILFFLSVCAFAQLGPELPDGIPFAGGGGTAPSFVQACQMSNFGSTSTCVFGSGVSINNTIAFGFFLASTGRTITSVTDNCGVGGASNTYTQIDTFDNAKVYDYRAPIGANTNPCTITVVVAGGTTTMLGSAHEIHGVFSTPVDVHTTNTQSFQNDTATDSITSGSVTTNFAKEYIFGFSIDANGAGGTLTSGTGYNKREAVVNTYSLVSEDKTLATAGAVAATFTDTGNTNACCVYDSAIVTFRSQ